MSLFTVAETLPFGVSFALIVAVAVLEGAGMMLSLSPSNAIDHWLPEIDGDTGLDRVLGWLHLGKVPSLVLVILFLAGYTVFGYSLQMTMHGLFGAYLPAWAAAVVAVPAGLATVRGLGSLIAHIIPRDETWSVSEQNLIGRAGIVSAGTARRGLAAQARVRDGHGRLHYLMVEPDVEGEEFGEGTQVLVVSKHGAFYRCIRNPHPALL
ncbi:MAG: DUF1449 family protein [Aquabacterium sp.]|nr:MAG: DUF1449 family protein [Aquabacterium sp.]